MSAPSQPDPVTIAGLAPALRVARELRGYTRAALAVAAAVPEDAIAAFEAGKSVPTRQTLDALWDVLAAETARPTAIRPSRYGQSNDRIRFTPDQQ